MIGMKRKEKMKKIISIFLLILLVNCASTNNTTEQPKVSIENVIEAFKSITIPR